MASQTHPSLGHVVVTGGCGFLGHHVVRLLLRFHPQSRISVLDLRTTNNRVDSPNVSYFERDITDGDSLHELLGKLRPDVVIHTASPTAFLPKDTLYNVNVNGTKRLLEASQEAGVKAFVYTSSASVIMDKEFTLINADERWPVVTGNDSPEYYSETKALAEAAILKANRTTAYPNFLTCAIRPAAIFGEGDVQFLPNVFNAARTGKYKFQLGNNENLFDCTYVENVAWGHLLGAVALLETQKRLPSTPLDHERVDGEAFFITNDSPVYFWDFSRFACQVAGYEMPRENQIWKISLGTAMFIGGLLENVMWLLGKKPNLTRNQARFSCMTRYFNIHKAKSRLGYAPIVSLEEGVRRAAKHTRERMEVEWAREKETGKTK